jgi:hypothetical protein
VSSDAPLAGTASGTVAAGAESTPIPTNALVILP